MQRTKLTEKLIRSTEDVSNSQPIILADTEIRSLQVFVYVFLATYRFKKTINGKRYNIKIGNVNDVKLSVARAIAQKLENSIRNKNHAPHSGMVLSVACAKILIPRYTNLGKSTNAIGIINNFLIPFFGEVKIDDLTSLMVQTAVYKLMADGYAPETIRKRILIGKTLYKQLIKYQLVRFNPFLDVNLPKVSNIRSVVLAHEQRLPFIQCCLDEKSVYADLLLLLLYTGLRVSEAVRIRLEDISDNATLTLPKTKAGVVQYISLNSLAQQVLNRRADLTWNQYLFPSTVHAGKPIAAPKGCLLRIKERMKAIGHDIDNLHMHDLRRSFASACAEVTNGDMHMVARQLRHSSTHILRRYVHYQPNNIAIASEATAQALIRPIHTQHELEAKS